jgi:hypothetical protein
VIVFCYPKQRGRGPVSAWLAKLFIKIAVRLNPNIIGLIHLGDHSRHRCIVLDTLFAKENKVAVEKAKKRLASPHKL